METHKIPMSGIIAALSTPLFLGLAPIFGKFAINGGADPFSVAALRTIVAVALLWAVYGLFFRRYMFIYPAGLMGCIVIGVVNGIGSLFYYSGLSMLDASLAQLLNGLYLAFALLLAVAAGQKADRRTVIRAGLALAALVLLTGFGSTPPRWEGVGLMLGSALMFAGTMILSQYVLYEMPSRTVTLYVLTTMGVVVTVVWLTIGTGISLETVHQTLPPIIILGVTTALSRLAMFAGVKFMGGMQTAILALAEIGVALFLAFVLLDESLSIGQWAGVGLLMLCLLLIRQRDLLPRGFNPNAILVANMSSVQFQRIAFYRAFGTSDNDNEAGTLQAITTQEILAIQRMMGAQNGGLDPFPITKSQQILEQMYEGPAIPDPRPPGSAKTKPRR